MFNLFLITITDKPELWRNEYWINEVLVMNGMFQEVAQVSLRIHKILFCCTEFLCGVDPPVLKLQKNENGDNEYISVVETPSPPAQVGPVQDYHCTRVANPLLLLSLIFVLDLQFANFLHLNLCETGLWYFVCVFFCFRCSLNVTLPQQLSQSQSFLHSFCIE